MIGIKRLGKNLEMEYKEINSSKLNIPRGIYQRPQDSKRVSIIATNFDECLANDPKVSFRDGEYYVFDGQHTIAARKFLNGGKDLPIMCRVYNGLSVEDEAWLFSQQYGVTAKVTPGRRIHALVVAGDPTATAFRSATVEAGLQLSYGNSRGKNLIGCVNTAFRQFRSCGSEVYTEALRVIRDAWGGHKDSLRAEVIVGMTEFIKLYHDEYDAKRLVEQCSKYDPLYIYRKVRAAADDRPTPQRYIYEVWKIYNGTAKASALPMKF